MVPHVLGVGYAYNEYEVTAGRWKEFEIEFDYAVFNLVFHLVFPSLTGSSKARRASQRSR